MEEAVQFLNDAGFYYIATVDSDGKPHVRPFGSRFIANGKFYISTEYPKAVYQQLIGNGYVELAAAGKDMQWIRIAAKAVHCEDMEVLNQIAEAFKGRMDRKPEDIAAFELTEVTCTLYQGQGSKSISW